MEWLRAGAGDRFADIELNALVFVVNVTDYPAPVREMMAGFFGVDAALIAESPTRGSVRRQRSPTSCGPPRERWGFSYLVVQGDALDSVAPIVAELAGT